ncbi:hypothetical protein B0I37DRAFT_416173 [Chaetomium sp. MPI-CAGE-AT-0009]|nr:hypothetical protein B0I37DRAFT_416173 [Chaetomium sp. MPI-CAGE-AT-0009]
MAPLLRYNLAPTLNGLIASLPSHTTPWIVEDPTIDFDALESVVVFTRDVRGVEEKWGREVTVVGEGVVEFVRGLKLKEGEGRGKDIWLMGGGELAGLLMRAGLVDVVEAAVMPVVVEQGKAEALKSGILMTRYRVVYD